MQVVVLYSNVFCKPSIAFPRQNCHVWNNCTVNLQVNCHAQLLNAVIYPVYYLKE